MRRGARASLYRATPIYGSCTKLLSRGSLCDYPPANWRERMEQSPTVRGRRLCRELKRLREAAGLSIEEASRRLDFSKSKLSRIENGRSRVITDDLEDMLDLYNVPSPKR